MNVVIRGPLAVAGSILSFSKAIGVMVPRLTASAIEIMRELPIKTERSRLW